MGTAVSQSTYNGTSAAQNTVSAAFTSNTTGGNTIVVIFTAAFVAGNGLSVSSIAISPGSGSFTSTAIQSDTSNGIQVEGWAAPNITGGTTPTVTVTMSRSLASGNTEGAAIAIYEVSGMPALLTTDGTAVGNSGTSTSGGLCTTSSITTTNAADILFSGFEPGSHMSSGESGWTFLSDGGSFTGFGSQYIIVSTTQTGLQATATCASGPQHFDAILFALQGTAGGSGGNVIITGNIAVTGTPVLTLAFSWTVPGVPLLVGTVTPTLTSGGTLPITITGSVAVTGVLQPSLAMVVSGTAIVTAALQTGLAIPISGLSVVTGTVTPALFQTTLPISITGGIVRVIGAVSLPQFPPVQSVASTPSMIYFPFYGA